MAKKQSSKVVKEIQIVQEGGVLYDRQIFLVQKNLWSLTYSDQIRYEAKLDTTAYCKLDNNDMNGLSHLYYKFTLVEEGEDVVTNNV